MSVLSAVKANDAFQCLVHLAVLVGSGFLAVGLLLLGTTCILNPEFAAKGYGVPFPEDCIAKECVGAEVLVSWVKAAGVRDFALGMVTLALLLKAPVALRWFLPAVLVLPLGDVYVAYTHAGLGAIVPHALGTLGIAGAACAAWLDAKLDSQSSATGEGSGLRNELLAH